MKQREDAIRLYRRGFNTRTISKRLGVSVAQVEYWVRSLKRGR